MTATPLPVTAIFDAADDPNTFNRCFRKLWASPDGGRHVLASYADGGVRQFECSSSGTFSRVTKAPISLASPLIDAAWCPFKDGDDSSVFVSVAKSIPVQMWDAGDGELRASYRLTSAMGESMSAQSVLWTADGAGIAAGFGLVAVDPTVVVFDVATPNAHPTCKYTSQLSTGLVSSLHEVRSHSLIAAGRLESFVVELVDKRIAMCAGLLRGHTGGVTKIAGSPSDELVLFSGSRNPDGTVKMWDLRNVAAPVATFERGISGAQFVGFEVVPTADVVAKLGVATPAATASGGVSIVSGGTSGGLDVIHVGAAASEGGKTRVRFAVGGPTPSVRWDEATIGAVCWTPTYCAFVKGTRVYRRFKHRMHRAQSRAVAAVSTSAHQGTDESDSDVDAIVALSDANKKRLRDLGSAVSFSTSEDERDAGPTRPAAKSTIAFVAFERSC